MPHSPVCVGLVFGGASGEHAVSIRSAATVLAALGQGANAERYLVRCFYIDLLGRWWGEQVAAAVLQAGTPARPEDLAPASRPGFQGFPAGALDVEVWLPVLHGPNGEDGTIQGLFTLMQVPFVGSGVLGSAVGMDKQAMKAAFAAAGLPQVPYACVQAAELEADPEGLLDRLETQLGYPCFVKPANLGSSVGISKASDRAALLQGLRQAAALDPRLVVEQGVTARELECAVLGTCISVNRPWMVPSSPLGPCSTGSQTSTSRAPAGKPWKPGREAGARSSGRAGVPACSTAAATCSPHQRPSRSM